MVFSIGGRATAPRPLHPQQRPEFLKQMEMAREHKAARELAYRTGVQKLSQEMQNVAARNKSAADAIRRNAKAGKPLLEK